MADSENGLKELEQMLLKAMDKKERNEIIVQVYEKGLSQHRIAQILKISQPAVSGIIKRGRK